MAGWYKASASGSVDMGFDSESGQTNDFNIGIHSFPTCSLSAGGPHKMKTRIACGPRAEVCPPMGYIRLGIAKSTY